MTLENMPIDSAYVDDWYYVSIIFVFHVFSMYEKELTEREKKKGGEN